MEHLKVNNFARFGKWTLTVADHKEVSACNFSPSTIAELKRSGFLTVPATVPGNFELDLHAAGIEPDPYFGQNPFLYQKYETSHFWYSTEFDCDEPKGDNLFLCFEGIDTIADIYLNGEKIGHADNMFIAHEFSVDGLCRKHNELIVHILPVLLEARKYGAKAGEHASYYTRESIHIRKSPSMYGWDIMPRFVSGGIWKPVSLIRKRRDRIEQLFFYTNSVKSDLSRATVRMFYEIVTDAVNLREEQLELRVDGVCGDSEFHTTFCPWYVAGTKGIRVDLPKLWYPKNAGEHPLYDVTVTFLRNGEVCDIRHERIGIRTVDLERTSITDEEGNGEFVFRVNGKKVFCLGTNWVPLDAFPSRFPKHRAEALAMLKDIGCNMVRCWGGNAYESDDFFDFCDENGIMVWQDFSMACAGYPQSDEFAAAITREAEAVIRRLRGHASLVLWSGNNEDDQGYVGWAPHADPNRDRISREVLPRVIFENDQSRPYLPSSPYVDEVAYRTAHKHNMSEEHLWGPRDYFKGDYYSKSICHFASETGYHGCPSPASLKKFISEDQLWDICDENGVPKNDWICHAAEAQPGMKGPYSSRIKLMMNQVETLFGGISDCLDDFCRQSQISQAEAVKYFIERFRISKWRRTGIIWWNLLDGWPQISDAVVDWYGCRKLAYEFIKRSQEPVFMAFDEPKDGVSTLYAVNDTTEPRRLTYTVKDLTGDKELAAGSVDVPADSSVPALDLPQASDYRFWKMIWQTDDGKTGSNHFTTKTKNISYDDYYADLKKADYDCFQGF